MYEWHDSKYLGGAHGLTGILYILLQLPSLLKDSAFVADVQACVATLASLERSDGNYPTREDATKDAELVQWCHGAPAFAVLFARAYELWKNDKVLAAAKRAADCVWRQGLLKKGLGVCHGMSGNGYVFLKLFQATGVRGRARASSSSSSLTIATSRAPRRSTCGTSGRCASASLAGARRAPTRCPRPTDPAPCLRAWAA